MKPGDIAAVVKNVTIWSTLKASGSKFVGNLAVSNPSELVLVLSVTGYDEDVLPYVYVTSTRGLGWVYVKALKLVK